MTLRLDIALRRARRPRSNGNHFTSRNIREAFDLHNHQTQRLEATGEVTRIMPTPLD
jgi:hypothetical protein